MSTSKTILITGASTGFGRDTAETLARAGHTVFASMRDTQAKNRKHANELHKQGINVVELDVSSDASVEKAIAEVLATVRTRDGLIINIGSILGRVTFPFFGIYGASKFAV